MANLISIPAFHMFSQAYHELFLIAEQGVAPQLSVVTPQNKQK